MASLPASRIRTLSAPLSIHNGAEKKPPPYLRLVEVAAAAVVQVPEGALAANLLKARTEVVRRIEEGRAPADPPVRGLRDDDGGRDGGGEGDDACCRREESEEQERRRRRVAAGHRASHREKEKVRRSTSWRVCEKRERVDVFFCFPADVSEESPLFFSRDRRGSLVTEHGLVGKKRERERTRKRERSEGLLLLLLKAGEGGGAARGARGGRGRRKRKALRVEREIDGLEDDRHHSIPSFLFLFCLVIHFFFNKRLEYIKELPPWQEE